MKRRVAILALLIVLVFANEVQANVKDFAVNREYQIKTAFLYNFLKTIEWPDGCTEDCNAVQVVIVGEHNFGDALQSLKSKKIRGKKIVVEEIGDVKWLDFVEDANTPTDSKEATKAMKKMSQSHLLFISKAQTKKQARKLLQLVEQRNILTIGEMEDFLEMRGIINFLPQATKGDFEVNLRESKKRGFQISSKLLRIATRIIEPEHKTARGK